MRRILLTCTLAFTLLPVFGGEGKAPPMDKEKSLLIDYVDPFIGTTNFGTTNPGAVCPNGMMSVVPFNVMDRHQSRHHRRQGILLYTGNDNQRKNSKLPYYECQWRSIRFNPKKRIG